MKKRGLSTPFIFRNNYTVEELDKSL